MTRLLYGAAVALTILLVPAAAGAQGSVTFVPSVSVSSVYDDNLFARTVGSGDQMTEVTPSLEASYESAITSIMALYSFDMQRSLQHSSLNDIEARRHARVDSRFQRSPQIAIGLNGRYDRTETAGELNFDTGLLFDRRRAERWQVTPSVGYQFSTRTTLSLLYDLTREGVAGSPMANEHTTRIGVTRLITPRTAAGVSYLGRHFINGHEAHTSSAALVLFTRQFSPLTVFRVNAGPRLSSRGVLAPEIVLGLARRSVNRLGYSLDYWRGESIILGVFGPVEVNSATARVVWPIVRKVEFGVSTGFFESSTLSQGNARVYHAEAVAAWSPMPMVIVAGSYGADRQRGDVRTSLLSDQTVVRHVFVVSLTVAPRLSRMLKPEDPLRPIGDPSRGER